MKNIEQRLEKLELDNRDKLKLPALVEKCAQMVKRLLDNPQPNRKLEDYTGDNDI